MTGYGNEKITVNYQLTWFQTYAPYEPEVLQSHGNFKTRAHYVDYTTIASNPLIKVVSLFNTQRFV